MSDSHKLIIAFLIVMDVVFCENCSKGGLRYVDNLSPPLTVWRYGNAAAIGGDDGIALAEGVK